VALTRDHTTEDHDRLAGLFPEVEFEWIACDDIDYGPVLGILAALASGALGGALVGGVELTDLPDPAAARAALDAAGFVVSLEVRASEVTERADVVLPVAPPVERAGSYWNWEGRVRSFGAALESNALPDHRVLHVLAQQLGADLQSGTPAEAHLGVALTQREAWVGGRVAAPSAAQTAAPQVGPGQAVLATWRLQLDAGRGQDGEQFLAGTAKQPVARLSAATAEGFGVADGGRVAVSTARGTVELPVAVTDGMVDGVVWLPLNSVGSRVHATLGAVAGDLVAVAPAGANESERQG
ncbi:molybdopterin-dependent oxidoreductase, partial [Promicromonospora citrea]|uniref:molybdopterin dinucleotide binding domain-containing protein n=1 Tax=Promicromonospora citrea TaxID=43677 RepID=UPI001488F3D9